MRTLFGFEVIESKALAKGTILLVSREAYSAVANMVENGAPKPDWLDSAIVAIKEMSNHSPNP